MKEPLELVKDYAGKAHKGQTRKYTPDEYIVHPVRVMEMCRKYTADEAILYAALLHDVLEDTSITTGEMKAFLVSVTDAATAQKTLQLVTDLTDVYVKSDYPKWNRRKRKAMEMERLKQTSPDSQTVKYADIIDNCREIVAHDADFAGIFLRECAVVLKHLDKGNETLRQLAIQTVNEQISKLAYP